jgi:hypothetical protein
MSLATDLSIRDQQVLSSLFINSTNEPRDAPPAAGLVDVDLPPDNRYSLTTINQLVEQEKNAIKFVDSKQYIHAMHIFNEIVCKYPNYASAYNNRAQLKRILNTGNGYNGSSNMEKKQPDNQIVQSVITDLKRAIELCHESNKVSKMQGTVLCQAYSQLGAVYLEQAKSENADGDRWVLEELASEALYNAGLYGNEVAKSLGTKINPYARLCGNIVKDALVREYSSVK